MSNASTSVARQVCKTICLPAITLAVGIAVGMFIEPDSSNWSAGSMFLAAQGLIALVILMFLPLLACSKCNVNGDQLRGLSLPRGSIRAMLALWIVGSYIILLVFMPFMDDSNNQETVKTIITAFGPLVGATIAFYFAGRSSSSPPSSSNSGQKAPS